MNTQPLRPKVIVCFTIKHTHCDVFNWCIIL